jgi:hypothetical protein
MNKSTQAKTYIIREHIFIALLSDSLASCSKDTAWCQAEQPVIAYARDTL